MERNRVSGDGRMREELEKMTKAELIETLLIVWGYEE